MLTLNWLLSTFFLVDPVKSKDRKRKAAEISGVKADVSSTTGGGKGGDGTVPTKLKEGKCKTSVESGTTSPVC